METKNIRQVVTFRVRPRTIYEALMDSKKHARFTAARASISRKVGGRISAYDGYIEGINVELVPGKRIVQAWRASDWPQGWFSKVIFTLAGTPSGTRLTFTHSGVPANQTESLRAGWTEHYWDKLKKYLAPPTRSGR
jgi:activator of HSP90 ATPase